MNQQEDSEIPPIIKITRLQFQTIPEMTQEVIESCQEREHGFYSKRKINVSPMLKACAEDKLVKKNYKEMKCDIPELTKSAFLMVFSPDGTKMASTHGNHNVYVTDLRTGKNIKTLVGHPRTPWCVAFHPSSNQILASGCLGGQVRIWDLSGGSEVWTTESQTVISSLAFHPVDRLLVIATYNELYFWDWSQPKPFMQTCTNNAKEKVRYVAFDRLGHKLITGIANTPQGIARWERVRAPVPVSRHFERIATFRRRITPRLVPPANPPISQPPNPSPPDSNLNNIPERERRIAVYYRNLMEQYEMLVHHCLEVYRPTTTMDRGTDPMEAEHLTNCTNRPSSNTDALSQSTSSNQTSSSNANASTNDSAASSSATNSSTNSSITTSGPVTISTQTVTQSARTSPLSLPGPSGLSRQSLSRPGKRSNTNLGAKSDSSTVYQSDSSSSSSSDESPTPKRRISLVPNVGIYRKTESGMNSRDSTSGNVMGDKFDKKKRLFMSRPSAFHPARIFTNINNPHVHRRLLERPTRHPGLSDADSFPSSSRHTTNIPNPRVSPDRPSRANRDIDDIPSPLSRLRGISEGSLSSADEVINFSERPIPNRDELNENYTPETPVEGELPESTGVFDNIYSNILSDLETSLNNVRNNRPHHSRNGETSSMLLSFSQRLENIMNQSDAILANLRRSMEMLMEPSAQNQNNAQAQTSTAADNSASRRIFILRKSPGFHAHNRQCPSRSMGNSLRGSSHSTPSTSFSRFSPRGLRYPRNRNSRFNNRLPLNHVWRPFDDHSYPRDPEQGTSGHRFSNLEPIRNLLTLSPRSPSGERPQTEETSVNNTSTESQVQPERSSTPAPFPSLEHNYPLTTSDNLGNAGLNLNLENPIADHTYPRDPQSSTSTSNPRECIAPLISSLHSTISHISIQTNLLRRQVESIELIDRARFEVFQLQELRRMWEEIRRHLNFVGNTTSERRSNMSNVRQMMAWTRISDPSPSSESAQSSTEQSTPEPSPSTERPTTSRSSASSSNESRTPYMSRFRHNYIKKRIQSRFFWRRRQMRSDNPYLNNRRHFRGNMFRSGCSRPMRYNDSLPHTDNTNLSEDTVSLMMRGLENLLIQQSRLFGRRDPQYNPNRSDIEDRVLSERVIHSRLRAARARLNRVNGQTNNSLGPLDESIEYSPLRNHNDWVRYETRLRLSIYIETLTRFIEDHSNNIPQALNEQIISMLELALLLTDLLLLQIMDSIPASSGSILDPERETLSLRIDQMCTNLLQNRTNIRSTSLTRVLHSLRLTACYTVSSLRMNRHLNDRRNRFGSNYRNYHREAMLELDLQLGNLLQFTNYLNETPPSPPPEPPTVNNTNSESNTTPMYRLGDLLNRLRTMRGRLEQISQNNTNLGVTPPSSSNTEPEPVRSTDESPSDRESESFEGFQPWFREQGSSERGPLYRTQHMNLYPPEQSSSQSSPERANQPSNSRPWNVPTVQVNSVPISESNNLPGYHSRTWTQRYISEIRPLTTATGLFRPRFLIPFYSGVNPFEADLDDSQREPPVSYDGLMTTTVSPNHRIQMWDISKCCIPNISNHEKNIVVSECKIHNDGSVDISRDGTLLVTLLPSGGYLNVTNRLGIYSIKWDTLGQCLYTTSFEQNAISVSLSPLSRHLIVGLASRRVTLLPSDRWTMARIFFLDDKKIKITGRGRLVMLRDLEQRRDRDYNFMSVNCIKWMPISGQGIVYATNTGQLKVLT